MKILCFVHFHYDLNNRSMDYLLVYSAHRMAANMRARNPLVGPVSSNTQGVSKNLPTL